MDRIGPRTPRPRAACIAVQALSRAWIPTIHVQPNKDTTGFERVRASQTRHVEERTKADEAADEVAKADV